MEYEIVRNDRGEVIGVQSGLGFHYKGATNYHWVEFEKWNALEIVPLDTSDKVPELPRVVPSDELEFTPDERKKLRALLKGN